jgi:hypothetical protein
MNVSTASGLAVKDYFTMDNTVSESNGDVDLGSGGAMVLPTLNDALGDPRSLAVGAGKDGTGYVVDRTNMGKFHSTSNAVFQQLGLGGSVFSSPAWFNNTLYYGPSGQPLQAFSWSGGSFGGSPSSQSPSSFGYPGTTPSISANGSANGIVWAAENTSPAVLHAYNAANVSNELYNSNQAANSRDHFGSGNKYITPTVVNGKVYVGTTNGVGVFGLLNCTYTVGLNSNGASSENFSSSAGGDEIKVTAPSGRTWTVVNTSNFIVVTGGASGTGNGLVSFTIPANPGVNRSAALVIAGHSFTVNQAGDTITTGLAFFPLTPCRVVDTRSGAAGSGTSGAFSTPSLVGGATRSFPIPQSPCNVPATAQAYSLNITLVPTAAVGYLTAWPTGSAMPGTTTLNSPNGAIVGNAAIVSAGTNGAISLFASNDTDVVIDINGYFAPPTSQGLAFYPVTPCRVVDTRSGAAGSGTTGAFSSPSLVAGATRNFPIPSSDCGIPSSSAAYSMRMTVVAPGPLGYLTTWPAGQPFPVVATLNALDGGVVGNEAIVPAGTNGAISVYATNNTDLVIDINGYFAPPGNPGALYFYFLPPCRVADTRSGSGFSGGFGPPSLVGGTSREFAMPASVCAIPDSALAYSLNMTVVVPSGDGLGYLTAWPTGQTFPVAATLNALDGGVVAAGSIVPAGSGGAINVFASNPTDLVIDINGYFAP